MQEFIDKLTSIVNEAGSTLPPDIIYYSVKEIYMQTENAYRNFQQQQKLLKEQKLNEEKEEENNQEVEE